MNQYQKLIRDKIPDIINSCNKKCQVKKLSNAEYKEALKSKLIEELQEILLANKDNLIEEIADVYEVIDTLIKVYKLNKKEIIKAQKNKQKLRGKFQKKYLLLSVNSSQDSINNLTILEQTLLQEGKVFLDKEVLSKANEIDRDSHSLKEILLRMNEVNSSFFKLKLSEKYNPIKISNVGFYSWQIMMAQYSGALAFLQTQHHSAMVMLNQSSNEIIKEKYLENIVRNNQFCGVGFSHLRRQGKPTLMANPIKNGYELTGFVPWITGYNIFTDFIIGATLHDGRELYGIVPFQNNDNLTFSTPMKLSAMNSTNTVTSTLNHWFLPSENVVMIKPHQFIHQKDQENVLHHGFFALGCAFAGLRILENNCQKINLSNVKESCLKLKTKTDNLQQKMFDKIISFDDNFEDQLDLRLQAINLAYRCAIASIITSKGESNQEYHDANRIYREALVYSVSGQTIPLLTRSLEALTN